MLEESLHHILETAGFGVPQLHLSVPVAGGDLLAIGGGGDRDDPWLTVEGFATEVETPDLAVSGFIDGENPAAVVAHQDTIDDRAVSPEDAHRLAGAPEDRHVAAATRRHQAGEVEAPGYVNDAGIDEGDLLAGFRVPGIDGAVLVERAENESVRSEVEALNSIDMARKRQGSVPAPGVADEQFALVVEYREFETTRRERVHGVLVVGNPGHEELFSSLCIPDDAALLSTGHEPFPVETVLHRDQIVVTGQGVKERSLGDVPHGDLVVSTANGQSVAIGVKGDLDLAGGRRWETPLGLLPGLHVPQTNPAARTDGGNPPGVPVEHELAHETVAGKTNAGDDPPRIVVGLDGSNLQSSRALQDEHAPVVGAERCSAELCRAQIE